MTMEEDRNRTAPNRNVETDEPGRANPSQEDIVGRTDEGDDDAEDFEDADEAKDDEEDLEA